MNFFNLIISQLGMFVIYILIGVIGVKVKIFNQDALNYFSKYIMKIAIPVMLFTNTINGTTRGQLIEALPIIFITVFMYMILLILGTGAARIFKLENNEKQIYRAATIFGNVGFMGIPILSAIFPEKGMLYVALFTIGDQGLLWTLGMELTSPVEQKKSVNVKEALLKMINPSIIAIILGIMGIIIGVKVPELINTPLTKIGSTTTPLAMIYLGGLFCYTDIFKYLKKVEFYAIVAVKMLLFPVLFYRLLMFLPINEEIRLAMTMLSAMPSMSSLAMFAKANGSEGEYAVGAVMVTTIASIVTLPIISYLLSSWFM